MLTGCLRRAWVREGGGQVLKGWGWDWGMGLGYGVGDQIPQLRQMDVPTNDPAGAALHAVEGVPAEGRTPGSA